MEASSDRKYVASKCQQHYIVAGMIIGRSQNSRCAFAFILVVLACGILLVETHGILGHALSIPAESEYNTPSALHPMEILASGQDSGNHTCGLCYCFRLLGQSLVPHAGTIIDFSYDIQPIMLRRICLIHTSALKTENRSPPQS
jgi:hypothetical protein